MKRLTIPLTLTPLILGASGDDKILSEQGVALCTQQPAPNPTVGQYFGNLFSTEHWPARWACGDWSTTEGWIYIISDITIFLAYLSIPIILFFYLWKKDLGIFRIITLAFGVFILACGITHLVDAIIFWEPIYRFSGFTRLITAIVSVGTVGLMIKNVPVALTYKSPSTMQKEVDMAVAEAAELNEVLRDSFEIAKIGTWELNLKTQQVVWSDSLYHIYEVELGTPIDLEISLKLHPGQDKFISDTISKALENKQRYSMDLLATTLKGTQVWTRAIGIPQEENGEVIRLKGFVLDIDAQKKLEIERTKSRELLEKKVNERTQELKTMNQELESFSYYISHDLRAPLRAINGFSEALMEDYQNSLDSTASRFLGRISYNSKKMGNLIDDILAFSRMNRKEATFKKVDLKLTIPKIIDDLFADSRHKIKIGYLPTVFGDKEMIDQVFVNLISNAVKYSSKAENPVIEINGEESEEACLIKISDNGVGFNMQYADKLFMAFQRLHSDDDFDGTGVGLALCQKIMQAHKGDIWADSMEGKGSVFFLKFRKEGYAANE